MCCRNTAKSSVTIKLSIFFTEPWYVLALKKVYFRNQSERKSFLTFAKLSELLREKKVANKKIKKVLE